MQKREPLALLKEYEIDYKDKGTQWVTVKCPYHADHDDLEQANGGINRDNGAFKCFKCGTTRTIIGMIATKYGVAETIIETHLDGIFGGRNTGGIVGLDLIEFCHKQLLSSTEYQNKLFTKHGIDLNTITKYQLGLYPSTQRITIPIKGFKGDYVNLRQYKYDADNAKIIGMKGSSVALYLHENVKTNQEVFITEGEFKAIILSERGFPACSTTGGAGGWRPDWNEQFRDKDVVIVYDTDDRGRSGAAKLCIGVYRWAKSVRNLFLTAVADLPHGSVKEYFVERKYTPEDFRKLVDNCPKFIPPTAPTMEENNEPPTDIPLAHSGKAEYHGKLIRTKAVVSAKDTAPYIVPKKCTVVCNKDRDYCSMCHVFMKSEAHTFDIPESSAAILEMVNTTEDGQNAVLKRFSKIFPNCKASQFRRDESYNVEEIRVIPQIAIGSTTEEQVTRKVYHVGHGIACNNSYEIEGRVCSEPKDGHATLVAYKAEPVEDDINNFNATANLSGFQPIEWTLEGIKAKLDDVYEDLENNVTRVYQRRDLHTFIDLVYHSSLFFLFDGKRIKGWADALIIGDSGQGKSETSSRLRDHYRAGERIDTKKASVAGLVGGLQETAKRWFVSWGTIPLNDRRLVILEEVKGMGVAEMSRMTDMRSSGIAEIIKIERARCMARTRLLWISNPRSDNNMSSYNYGVLAVKELIGALEDIRRFDMVMAVVRGEVPQELVNMKHRNVCPHVYTSDMCSQLVGWSWSRDMEEILFEPDAEQEILDVANRMGKKYSSSCPIVEPSDQRLKVARLSVAIACRTYSTDDGSTLRVRRCHVQYIEEFLDRIYSSQALGYLEYSFAQKGETKIDNVAEAEACVRAWPNARDTVRGLLEAELITEQDLVNYTDWLPDRCAQIIGQLTRLNCLKRNRGRGYRKTGAFIELLKRLDQDDKQKLTSITMREMINKDNI